MKITLRLTTALLLATALVAMPTFAADLATWGVVGDSIVVSPNNGNLGHNLTVSAPNGVVFSQQFAAGEQPSFRALDDFGQSLGDGSYTVELTVIPARRDRSEAAIARQVQTFYANMVGGSFVSPSNEEVFTKDQVILDDLIVSGSICAGMDCVNGESFGFDTIRLKENNLRIRAQDTSSTASFPSRDWQITFNDSANGGANKFSIDDIDGGRTPFTIEAGAPSHSLYVDDAGRIGFGTATPVVELHVKDGDTPTLRLEQDGSNGFGPQTWDVAGNETNFFVRDASNGSRLPFKIVPAAPTNSIYVAADGNVGLGTSAPAARLHLLDTGPVTIQLTNTASSGDAWRFNAPDTGAFRISDEDSGTASTEFELDGPGNLAIAGQLTVCLDPSVCTPTTTYPDYVFEPDYSLMSLGELKTFIEENKHLPNVPSVDDVTKNGLNMTELQVRLLEKVEELTLYTLSQQDTIEALQARLDSLTEEAAE